VSALLEAWPAAHCTVSWRYAPCNRWCAFGEAARRLGQQALLESELRGRCARLDLHLTRTDSAFDYRALIRPLYDGMLRHGGGFDRDSAASLIAQRSADAAVFGSL